MLYFSDMASTSVFAWDGATAGAEVIAKVPGRPGGLGWLPDGSLLAVSMDEGKVYRQRPDGSIRVHADVSDHIKGSANDMYVDPCGRAYVGSYGFDLFEHLARAPIEALYAPPGPPRIGLVRVSPDGDILGTTPPIAFPNGMIGVCGTGRLVVAESLLMRLVEYEIGPDGALIVAGTWASFAPDQLRDQLGIRDDSTAETNSSSLVSPDGIAAGLDGTIWVANATAPECVEVERGGRIVNRVVTTNPALSCVIGGPDLNTLFVATAPTSDPVQARALRSGRIEVFDLP